MKINQVFAECVGQESVKRTLSLYIEAFKNTGRLPFLNLTTQKGGGKSFFVRRFKEGLIRSDGSIQPVLEVNGQIIKDLDFFFDEVYPVWTQNNALLFVDEGHNLPMEVQQALLSILEVKKESVRMVKYDGLDYRFDFEEISFITATTDQQKLVDPLKDRLKNVCFEEYTLNDLYEVFIMNLDGEVSVCPSLKPEIKKVFRGNPRDAVCKAEDVKLYASAKKQKTFNLSDWGWFCEILGVLPQGLNHSEMTILKHLSKRGAMSLTSLSALTGFERGVIQKDYEKFLVKKNFLVIDGKRRLTSEGEKFATSVLSNAC